MACMICLVTISRSSSERCVRRSARPAGSDGGAGVLPTLAAHRLLASSCCITSEWPAPEEEGEEEEETAQDASSTSSKLDSSVTFPDMTECKRRPKRRNKHHSCADIHRHGGQNERVYLRCVCVCALLCVCVCVSRQQRPMVAVNSDLVLHILLYPKTGCGHAA